MHAHLFRRNLPHRIHPRRIRDFSVCQAKTDIFGMRGRDDRVDIHAVIDVYCRRAVTVAATLDDTLPGITAIGSSGKIDEGRILKCSQPVVYPFHHVAHHIADTRRIWRHGTDLAFFQSRITSGPRKINIPALVCHERPFRFCRQAESIRLFIKAITAQIDATSNLIELR